MNYFLDTPILLWVLAQPDALTAPERRLLTDEGHHFFIPTMSVLEIGFLNEIKRIKIDVTEVTSEINRHPRMMLKSFDEMALLFSLKLSGNRDPFDRVILGQALATNTKIITRDRWMKKTAPQAMAV